MEHIFTSVDVAAAASSNSASVVETFTMLISQKQTLLSSDTSCVVEKRLCLAPQCTSSPFTSFIFCFSLCFVFFALQSPATLCLQNANGVPRLSAVYVMEVFTGTSKQSLKLVFLKMRRLRLSPFVNSHARTVDPCCLDVTEPSIRPPAGAAMFVGSPTLSRRAPRKLSHA